MANFADKAGAPLALIALLATSCASPGDFIDGIVEIDMCPPGPDLTSCAAEIRPAGCSTADGDASQATDPITGSHFWREAGVSIHLSQTDDRFAVTRRDGYFLFEGLDTGRYALAFTARDTVERRVVTVANSLATDAGESAAHEPAVHVAFTAAGTLEGQVVLGDTVPLETELAGIEIELACPPRTAITDARGRFRMEAVPVGERLVSAVGDALVGATTQVYLKRGRTSSVAIVLDPAFVQPEAQNRAPTVDPEIRMELVADPTTRTTPLRPPGPTLSRGQRVSLECQAIDADGDGLQYVWAASSGALEALEPGRATLQLGSEDIGISCTVLDGRGGIGAASLVVTVSDYYIGGAALTATGAVFAAASDNDFDLMLWNGDSGETARVERTFDQWLPVASAAGIAWLEPAIGHVTLWAVAEPELLTQTEEHRAVATDPAAHLMTPHGAVWIDTEGHAWFLPHSSNIPLQVGHGYSPPLSSRPSSSTGVPGSPTIVAFGFGNDAVVLHTITASNVSQPGRGVPTPGRDGGAFSSTEMMTAYWAQGEPTLTSALGLLTLGGPEAVQSGRIVISAATDAGPSQLRVAYSAYNSPSSFVEATVVEISVQGGSPSLSHTRVGIGPSEVLDFFGDRLLLATPRMNEDTPSRDAWVVDLGVGSDVP